MVSIDFDYTVLERFLRYVTIDTQSDPNSATAPSTERQKDLARLLVGELREAGLVDADMDANGYVYATLPATSRKRVPVVCFCSHMDTSPDAPGAGVKPQLVRNYQGGDIALPADKTQVIRFAEHPALKDQIGNDIVTADGTTLLGADNKAGVAEIVDAMRFLAAHSEIPHGTIKVLFTPDEEIGRGVDNADLKRLAADVAYTIDGESAGQVEDETFSADGATVTVQGVPVHPGFAKGAMENAVKIAARIIENLPQDTCSPETTEAREGFIHPLGLEAGLDHAKLKFILRDFSADGLKDKAAVLERAVKTALAGFPRSSYTLEVTEQYRNMKEVLDRHPDVAAHAMAAVARAGLAPKKASIRGGTDGSRLSFMGLPCPNIFAGEHAFHSRLEWVSVQDMQAAMRTIVHLATIWEERT
ncbi:MAG TPA: peptidase T [Pseudolabrys sp.]